MISVKFKPSNYVLRTLKDSMDTEKPKTFLFNEHCSQTILLFNSFSHAKFLDFLNKQFLIDATDISIKVQKQFKTIETTASKIVLEILRYQTNILQVLDQQHKQHRRVRTKIVPGFNSFSIQSFK